MLEDVRLLTTMKAAARQMLNADYLRRLKISVASGEAPKDFASSFNHGIKMRLSHQFYHSNVYNYYFWHSLLI